MTASVFMRERGRCPQRLDHDRDRVRGQHVLAWEHGQHDPVARLESAAAAQRRRNRDVGFDRHGDQAARVPAGDHHARRGGKGQLVTRPTSPARW